MSFNVDLPTSFVIDAPYDDLLTNLDAIEALARQTIKQKTSREITAFKLTELRG